MDSITSIYLESLSVFKSSRKLLGNTLNNLDTGQRPLNTLKTDSCKAALTLSPDCCCFYGPHTSPLHGVSPTGRWQSPMASPCIWEVLLPRSDATFVHSCCYLPFQWEICVLLLLQITQKSLFTSSQLLCDTYHHPGPIWPTNFKQSFVCSCQIFFWYAVFSIRLSYQIPSFFPFLCSGCFQIN